MSIPEPTPDDLPFSKAAQAGRVWVCRAENDGCTRKQPCRSCLGRRNRRKGQVKQRQAKKLLGVPNARFRGADAHEEAWGGHLRNETKAGAQAGPVWTRFLLSEKQSEQNRAIGDARPFVATFMPDGVSDGLFVCRLSKLPEVVMALNHHFFEEVE